MSTVKRASLAELAQEAVSSAQGELGAFRQKPFETMFRYIGPAWAFFRGHPILALLLGVAENYLGFGPSKIGAMLDQHFGFGGTDTPQNISAGDIASAATGLVDKIVGSVAGKSSSFRASIVARGDIDMAALVAAWAQGPDKMVKEAVHPGTWTRQLFGIKGYSKNLLVSILYQFIKFLLVGFGTAVGLDVLGKEVKRRMPTSPLAGFAPSMPGATRSAPISAPGMRLYTNPAGNVERSLVMVLDNTVRDKDGRPFSRLFVAMKGYPPNGSPEMERVLAEVRAAHGGADIREINGYRTFAAPPLAEMAKMLLPQATYTKETTGGGTATGKTPPDVGRELEGIFGGPR